MGLLRSVLGFHSHPQEIMICMLQVPDEDLIDRVAGRRLDPETGDIYHLKHKPPPEDVKERLIQRGDDTAEKVKTRLQSHHSNVDAVLDYYQDVLVEVGMKSSWMMPPCIKPRQVVMFCQPVTNMARSMRHSNHHCA